ncbi:MAG: nicotinate-nucleotide--dimethylbenzimidazole phosphoribosyltransferase, partial [Candidatus Aenigmarchaeota archaeon]|nr:nicotinate-nucleotide--dimethylbenzimidazole phosphoribosyltransferase [Candidatus Aenigmarchaeota archaeon]
MDREAELQQRIREVKPLEQRFSPQIQRRLDSLTKPLGSLGMLEEFVRRLGDIQGTLQPRIGKKRVYVFVSDHGVAEEGVSAYPSSVTRQMVSNFLSQGAAISVLARHHRAEVVVVDVGVNAELGGDRQGFLSRKVGFGTKNFLKEPAMSREQALESILLGIELARQAKEEGITVVGAGEMGIGNTTASAAVCSLLCRRPVEEVTGYGTGISEQARLKKVDVIKEAISRHRPVPFDPLDALSKVGGFDIGALAGLAIGCALHRIPVVSDGFIPDAGLAL